MSTFKKRAIYQGRYPRFRDDLIEELGDALWYLTSIATRNSLSLEEIAQNNLEKTRILFDGGDQSSLDSQYPEDERFPRRFSVSFEEREIGRSVLVKMRMNEVIIGDALTDNANDDDGYRYHDAFHLANAAVLGWSPVVRAILKRKRKSDPRIDEVEDGARAAIVEEAISIFVFNDAKQHGFYEGITALDLGLLQQVMALAGALEVRVRTAKQWEQAILKGYSVFRQLRAHRGGKISLDLDARNITFSEDNV
jgi:hypothetical protein